MTALCIIGGIILFILLLSLIPLSFQFKYNGAPELYLRYLFFKFRLVPPKEKEEAPKGKKQEKTHPEKKPKEKASSLKKLYKKRGLDGMLEILGEVADILKNARQGIFRHTVIKKLKIDITVVGEDAADTAMKYSYVCAAVYPTVSFIDSNMKLKRKELDIAAGFNDKETKVFAESKVNIRLLFLLKPIISAAVRGIKLIVGIRQDME